MQCPLCKKKCRVYEVFIGHLVHHGYTHDEAERLYTRLVDMEEIE